MVLTRRAAKKQLEEAEKTKNSVDTCQDVKNAEQDSENLQPQKQKKVIKAKAAEAKRMSLAATENQQISEEIKESPKPGPPAVPASPPLAQGAASPPSSPTSNETPQSNEAKTSVVDTWEDLVMPEEAPKEKELAVEKVNTKAAVPETATTTPVPAFITALAQQKAEETKKDKTEVTIFTNSVFEPKDLDEEKNVAVSFLPVVEAAEAAVVSSSPKQGTNTCEGTETLLQAEIPKSLEPTISHSETNTEDGKETKKKKHKGFAALHGTRKDHGASIKHKAPQQHEIVHPTPAALVEAVQMSADSLQAQLDALTLGPSNARGDGFSNRSSAGTPYFQRNPESTALVSNHLAALSSQLHRLTLCVGTLQQEIAAAATPAIPDVVGRTYLVLDTCALMNWNSDLSAFIGALINQQQSSSKGVSVLVPLELVRELDGLKESRDEKRRASARKAISILSDLQRASNDQKKPGDAVGVLYRGQRQHELLGPCARRGDDGFLDCMILFENAGAGEIRLVTQDNNFALRAQIEGFKVMNVAQALAFVSNLNPSSNSQKAAPVPVKKPQLPPPPPKSSATSQQQHQKKEKNATAAVTLAPPPNPSAASQQQPKKTEKKTAAAVTVAPPPPPLTDNLPSTPKQVDEENITPNAKQQQPLPSSPSLTFTIPLVWAPQPPPAPSSSFQLQALEAPQTVAATAKPAATPFTFKKWQTENGKLVRPAEFNAKQWRSYKYRYFRKMRKVAQSTQKNKEDRFNYIKLLH